MGLFLFAFMAFSLSTVARADVSFEGLGYELADSVAMPLLVVTEVRGAQLPDIQLGDFYASSTHNYLSAKLDIRKPTNEGLILVEAHRLKVRGNMEVGWSYS